jgi:Helix-turn-helix of DDE superfamily endonuclease
MTVSKRALIMLADVLRRNRAELRTRWHRLDPGRQALLVVAHLRKGETYADLATGFGIGTTTVYRYLREALELLAAMAPSLQQAIEVAPRQGLRHPRRHPAAHRPRRHDRRSGPPLLLGET